MLEFDIPLPLILGAVITVVLPLFVGIVTKYSTSSRFKAILLAALTAVNGLFVELLSAVNSETTYNLGAGLFYAVISFATAVGIHQGLLKPTGVTAIVQEVGNTDH